jgi:BolA protein
MLVRDKIKAKLQELNPSHLSISDVSAKHAGHMEIVKASETHFDLIIISEDFVGISKQERHRMIYRLLQQELEGDIHALSIKAYSSCEYHPTTKE